MKLTLALQWTQRAKLMAEGDKLMAEGAKLLAEGDKLLAEGEKLLAEGAKLLAEGEKLWADAILEIYGNITLEWKFKDGDYDCILGNGEHYVAVKDAA